MAQRTSDRPAVGKAGSDADQVLQERPESSVPLYLQVAQVLHRRIANNEYEVNSLLPTELELADELKVSRHTIRQAIQLLRSQGLLSAIKGVGTRVDSDDTSNKYYYSLRSLQEIFQFTQDTELDIADESVIAVQGKLAAELGVKAGRQFVYLRGVRRFVGEEEPFGFVEVWVDGQYRSAVKGHKTFRTAIFSLIEQKFGEIVIEATQTMESVLLSEEHAAFLQFQPPASGLKITRRFLGSGRRLMVMATSVYLGDRFAYRLKLTRDQSWKPKPQTD